MPRRMTSLSNIADLAISREIDSKYDVVKQVAAKLPEIEQIAGEDIDGLITSLNAALDFTGITVVGGEVGAWNPATKVLTVPTVKGDTGATGAAGTDGLNGADGVNGLTPNIQFSVDPDGNLQYEITYS